MSETKLLPCPFCGGEADIFEASEDSFCALCTDCGVETPYQISAEEAIATWNRRAEPENEPLTLAEIYETENEPLYFHCTVGRWSLNGWHIVNPINYDGVTFKDIQLDNNEEHVESLFNYGITWVAYRQKPEEDENEMGNKRT